MAISTETLPFSARYTRSRPGQSPESSSQSLATGSVQQFAMMTCSNLFSWSMNARRTRGSPCPRLLHHQDLMPSISFLPSFRVTMLPDALSTGSGGSDSQYFICVHGYQKGRRFSSTSSFGFLAALQVFLNNGSGMYRRIRPYFPAGIDGTGIRYEHVADDGPNFCVPCQRARRDHGL